MAKFFELNPWKGGGFGMFASVDGIGYRGLRYYAIASDGKEVRVISAPAMRADEIAARMLPIEPFLKRLGERMARAKAARKYETLRIELRRVTMRGRQMIMQPWKTYTYDLSAHGYSKGD